MYPSKQTDLRSEFHLGKVVALRVSVLSLSVRMGFGSCILGFNQLLGGDMQ